MTRCRRVVLLMLAALTAGELLHAAIPDRERSALLALYHSTGGAQWTTQTGWGGAAGTECQWYGITCDAVGDSVTSISLPNNNLHGMIPPQIRDLSGLSVLNLGFNDLSGPIPPEILSLADIRVLDLHRTGATGSLPDLGRLQKLEELRLDQNKLEGPLPQSITSLASLELLDVWGNALTGTIPADIDRLRALRSLYLGNNQLTGSIPPAINRMTALTELDLYSNALTGAVPPLDALTNLVYLDLSYNQLSGPLPDLRSLKHLGIVYASHNLFSGAIPAMFAALAELDTLDLSENALTGPLPPSLTSCPRLTDLRLGTNQLSGVLPPGIGDLKALQSLDLEHNQFEGALPPSLFELQDLLYLSLYDNNLSGTIPPQLAALTKLRDLSLGANRFAGPIPPELGTLKDLRSINVGMNALSGPVPVELENLSGLMDHTSNFSFNRLTADDPNLRAFVDLKSFDVFEKTQTVPPTNVRVTATTDRSITVEWNTIDFWWGKAAYRISASLAPGGTAVATTTTTSIWTSSAVLHGLKPSTTYYVTVVTVSYPWFLQRNVLVSDPAPVVEPTTGPAAPAPADVEVIAEPHGLVQVAGVPQNEDSFTLGNFGDVAAQVVLTTDAAFITVSPGSFTLAPGATQTVVLKSAPQPAGTYYGHVYGAESMTAWSVSVRLLSAVGASGEANAEAVAPRIEIVGDAGSTSLGTATFRNTGTASLNGIAVSDVPWLLPSTSQILIFPGQTSSIPFTIDRARRSESVGSVIGNLSLVYVAGMGTSAVAGRSADAPATVKVCTVTVVDVAKTQVTPGSVPALSPNEVAYFIPAVTSLSGSFGSLMTDVAIANAFGSKALADVRLYFTPAGGAAAQSVIASLGPIAGAQSVNLANVVTNVYGATNPSGALQIRTADWNALIVAAKLMSVGRSGTYAGDAPVFRSDRSAEAGAQTVLTGLRQGNGYATTIFLQETAGSATSATVVLLDAGGATVASRTVSLPSFAFATLDDLVTDVAVTAVVTTAAGAPGRLCAFARVVDGSSGESWSIVDWTRYYGFEPSEPARVPLAAIGERSSASSPRRRAVRLGSGTHGNGAAVNAEGGHAAIQLSIFNPSSDPALITLDYITGGRTFSKDLEVGAMQTASIADAAAFTAASRVNDATMLIRPQKGKAVVTARIVCGASGTAVAIVPKLGGLRLGKAAVFSGLEDSTAKTIGTALPGTYRTTYGFLETGGAPVTVRVKVLLGDGRSLVSTVATRTFELAAGQLLVVPDLVQSIVGADRETRYPDLHNLQLQLDVIGGSGAIVPFVTMTDNATGDSVMRLE